MNIITYLRELLCYFMNKKVGQYENNSEVNKEQNTNIYRYSTISDLSILGKNMKQKILFLKGRITGFHKILFRVIIQII